MSPNATIYHFDLELSDVDRGVYETLSLRVARHPSENLRFLLSRVLAYACEYQPGIAFSKEGLASVDEAPVVVHDPTGKLLAWIDIGSPSHARMHKALKLADRVALYTAAPWKAVQKELTARPLHRAHDLAIYLLPVALLEPLEAAITKRNTLTLTRSDEVLYLQLGSLQLQEPLQTMRLLSEEP